MPWKETRTVDQRLQFLSSYQREEMSVTDLCHEYGISRPTAYKWIKRYDEVGPEGLLDLTRTSHSSPYATSVEIENEVLALRKRFPSWGARKLKARLERMNPNANWPAASTVGQILSRAGLTNPRRKKRRATPSSQPFSTVTAPNQLWCLDFKGYFLTGDGYRCDPFTITDAHSRFLIRCQAVARMDLAQVSAVCNAAMREFGMPERIRTDNGAPFAGVGLLGLSKRFAGMDEAWHRSRMDSARTPSTKRKTRTNASHAEGGHREAAGTHSHGATEEIRSVPLGVQLRTTP